MCFLKIETKTSSTNTVKGKLCQPFISSMHQPNSLDAWSNVKMFWLKHLCNSSNATSSQHNHIPYRIIASQQTFNFTSEPGFELQTLVTTFNTITINHSAGNTRIRTRTLCEGHSLHVS